MHKKLNIKDIFKSRTYDEIVTLIKETRKDLDQDFNNVSSIINSLLDKINKEQSLSLVTKFHREILDYELLRDVLIECSELQDLSDSLNQWITFPGYDDGVIFKSYKQLRFDTEDGKSRDVTDQEISVLLSSGSKTFHHNKDYTEIRYAKEDYILGNMQANVIRFMHEEHLKGKDHIYQQDILDKVQSGCAYLKDVFKKSTAWGKLIIRVKNHYYKLDID